jgi:SAM-dependent methyltransferase
MAADPGPTLAAYLAGEISAPVALMRLMLGGMPADRLPALLRSFPGPGGMDDLATLAREKQDGLARLEAMVRAGADHAGPEEARAMFDRLAAISPEAAVAAYSLGDPALLAEATAEILAWLRGLGLLAGRPRVLDLGCGIGRLAAALAPQAGGVLGLDVSPAMVAAARARLAGIPGVAIETCNGHDLAGLPDGGFGLVLAADVFPYLVQAGAAPAMLAEAARVLAPGGHLAILNYGYRDLATDRAEIAALAPSLGLALRLAGERPFRLWDGAAFLLQRPVV